VFHPHLKPKKFANLAKKKEGFQTLESNEHRRAFTFAKEEETKIANTGIKSSERLEMVEKILASLLGQILGQGQGSSKTQLFLSEHKNNTIHYGSLFNQPNTSKINESGSKTKQIRISK
jgi:hypothetical protein